MKKGLLILFAFLLVGCGTDENSTVLDLSIPTAFTVIQGNDQMVNFSALLQKADLDKNLHDMRAITVFVPIDSALSPILQDREVLSSFLSDPANLEKFVSAYIVPRKISPSDLEEGLFVTFLDGVERRLQKNSASLIVDDKAYGLGILEDVRSGFVYPLEGVWVE